MLYFLIQRYDFEPKKMGNHFATFFYSTFCIELKQTTSNKEI
jgi:hypothetical protein